MYLSVTLALVFGLAAQAKPVDIASRGLEVRGLDLRQSLSSTRNELIDGPCKPVTVIFARGTTEDGNVGTLVGPPLFNNLGADIGNQNIAVQGVDYAADVAGYQAGGDPAGGAKLASLVRLAGSKCPDTQIALGGYSQGAQVVYIGASQLSQSDAARIRAVVLFGNPNNGKPVPNVPAGNTVTYCNIGDLICEGEPVILPTHLTYATDTPAAAQFIAQRVTV